ncbi:hypothetical protein C8F01DRAFT_1248842 [Mycena amicta]|nr:hypothetical protein C8F01DRAFT_1248842 [Mycena amicta]
MSLYLASSLPQLQSTDSERSTVLPAPSEDDIAEVMALLERARSSTTHPFGPFASAYDLGDGRYIKYPRVQMVFNRDGYQYLVMDAANGNSLASQYIKMSDEELMPMARQLRGYVDELKQLGAGVSTLGSWPEGPYRNVFFYETPDLPYSVEAPSSAFQTVHDFHLYWCNRFGNQPIVATLQQAMVEHAHETDVVFSHGDLNASNIIISDAPQRIVAIIDWETLGWYPSCWEEMSIWRGVRQNLGSSGWTKAVRSVFGPRQGLTAVYYEVVDALSDDPV